MASKPKGKGTVGVYRTADGGWAAYDGEGRTWRVTAAEAEAIAAKTS